MKRVLLPLLGLLLALACNLPMKQIPTPTHVFLPTATFPPTIPPIIPSPFPILTPTPIIPTETPTAPLPTITPTFTPSVPSVSPKDQPVNCRYGPGPEWLAISALKLGATAEIVGRNQASTWWYIKDPLHAGAFCWVWSGATIVSGNVEGLPVLPPPEAKVIDVKVTVSPGGGICPGPMTVAFRGSISTNGPTTITYRWEIRGDADYTTSQEMHTFAKADTWTFDSGALHLSCGSYRVILHVLAPNDMKAEARFTLP